MIITSRSYVPSSDTYIERTKLGQWRDCGSVASNLSALLERNDVIVVASVSCIYGLGSPTKNTLIVSLRPGLEISR